ncbi:MAG: hypothetical protein ACYC6A_14805 [Armatimonadota bacterium]
MIWDSGPWKSDLLRRAEILKHLRIKKGLSEEDLVEVELTMFVAFYTIRKLIEARTKLSTSTVNRTLTLISYSATGKPTTLLNWHHIDDHYDMRMPGSVTKDIRFVCNQFIHSYTFASCMDENGCLESILVTSDREKDNCIYRINVDSIIRILILVGTDDPTSLQLTMNPKTGDYDVQAK